MSPRAEPLRPWRRHQLVWLDEFGWYRILATSPGSAGHDAQVQGCLELWAERRWPLVVTRQAPEQVAASSTTPLALGLPAPARWGRRRIAVEVLVSAVCRRREFPLAAEALPLLPAEAQGRWKELCVEFERLALVARIYGSYGWQQLTGMDYLHPGSDIDLLLEVADEHLADAACGLLQRAALAAPRIDGELVFPVGTSVAWREWARWRAGETSRILVKRIDDAVLIETPPWEFCT